MISKLKLASIFTVGFLLGGAATGWAIHHCFKRSWSNMNNADYLLGRLSSKLSLTAGQKDKVAALLKEEMPKRDALRKETREKFTALAESFNTRLKPILNPDQQRTWDGMCARWKGCSGGKNPLLGCGGPASMGSSPLPATVK